MFDSPRGHHFLLRAGALLNFELQPHLKGDLIELRPLAPGDFDVLYEAGRDPLIWEQHPQSRVIGCTRYCNLKQGESEIEIGWTFLERAFWGGGVNGEMKSLMLDPAFRFVERVVFVVYAITRSAH